MDKLAEAFGDELYELTNEKNIELLRDALECDRLASEKTEETEKAGEDRKV